MVRTRRLLEAAVALFFLIPLGISAQAPKGPLARFTPEQQKILLAGEPVFEYKKTAGTSDQGQGQAMIVINAGADECFKIFRRLDEQREYFPRKTRSEAIKEEGGRVWLRNEFDFYVAKVEYTSVYTIDPAARRFDFEMDKSYPHSINESAGYFLFEPIDATHTLFTYAATRLDTGAKVPAFVQQYITSRDLPAQAVNVKKRIESGGKWKDK